MLRVKSVNTYNRGINSNFSEGQMKTYEVIRGPHYVYPGGALWHWRNNSDIWTLLETVFASYSLRKVSFVISSSFLAATTFVLKQWFSTCGSQAPWRSFAIFRGLRKLLIKIFIFASRFFISQVLFVSAKIIGIPGKKWQTTFPFKSVLSVNMTINDLYEVVGVIMTITVLLRLPMYE